MASKVETVEVQEEATPEDAERIGTLNSVLSEPEIVVGEPEEVVVPRNRGIATYVIRVNSDIEDMSYVAAGKVESYNFKAGHEYRVPWYIAQELENTGRIWH
jgi:hypothetical protein